MGSRPLIQRRDRQVQNLHDTVVEHLARYWRNPSKYNISTNPGPEKSRWVGSDENFPDLIGWVQDDGSQRAVWLAEVETIGSVTKNEAREQWAKYSGIGVPLYVVVPEGYGRIAKALTVELGFAVARFYEFSFPRGAFVLQPI